MKTLWGHPWDVKKASISGAGHLQEWFSVWELAQLQISIENAKNVLVSVWLCCCSDNHRRSQYEANRGTRLGKILSNTVDFYFFYQTDNIRRFHTADFVQRTVCSPRL